MSKVKIDLTEAEFRAAMVALARSQVGYVEGTGYNGRSNYTKYWAVLYPPFQGQPWCGAYVTWLFYRLTGIKLGFDFFNSYYTPAIVSAARRYGAWKTGNPLPGDWCLMNFKGGNYVDHVGITAHGRTNIEGNTSSTNKGSQSNGGGVYVRTRSSSMIAGWVDVVKLAKAVGVEFKAPSPSDRRIEEDGELGPITTKLTQRWLNLLRAAKAKRGAAVTNWPLLVVDGDWGPLTTRALQSASGAVVDGEDGPETARKLGDLIKVKTIPTWSKGVKQYPGLIKGLQRYLNLLILAKAL